MRIITLILPLLIALNLCFAQEQDDTTPKHWPTGCEDGAVEVDLSRAPAMEFRKLSEAPPSSYDDPAREFSFSGGSPFTKVQLFFSATVATGPQYGPDSHARLSVYARTEGGESGQTPGFTWWKLVPTASYSRASVNTIFQELMIDSEKIANCFLHQTSPEKVDCAPASVDLATSDPSIALAGVSFSQNFGGANAFNWTNSDILLDFRSSPPKVLAGVDCAYNEGGGACTALIPMPRYTLTCEHLPEKHDFLCTEATSTAYRDYYLLASDRAPLRSAERDSLTTAWHLLQSRSKGSTEQVRGYGPVGLLDELPVNGENVAILGGLAIKEGEVSGETFHFLCNSPSCAPVTILPHTLLNAATAKSSDSQPVWTPQAEVTFTTKRISEGDGLTVNEVIASRPGIRSVYWIGIEKSGTHPTFDVLQVASEDMAFVDCGTYSSAETVLSATINNPFSAAVTVQPAFKGDLNGDAVWMSETNDELASDCVRKGTVRWIKGKGFETSLSKGRCPTDQNPRYISIDENGKVTLTDQSPLK